MISRHFDLIVSDLCHQSKGSSHASAILIALANGRHKIEELVADVGLNKARLLLKINRLAEEAVVVKNGNFYFLKDKLFRYWIKYVFQKRLKDVDFTTDKQRKRFKEEFNRCVEEFKVMSRKDFSSRIVELLHCFDNEAFDLNGRRYKLPTFREVAPLKIRNEENGSALDAISARTDGGLWYIVLKKDNFAESDVSAIIKEGKRSSPRLERCLIISLTDLDENAKLKALEERFWIWNESELKTLLTLFNKPYIVR